MEYILITNDTKLAAHAQDYGIQRIMIDLEMIGKLNRQGHLNSVISGHTIEDVRQIRGVLQQTKLQVRINPIYEYSKREIDQVIDFGADILMLPMFTSPLEVKKFIEYVDGRAKVMLLLETAPALVRIDEIIALKGIDEIYIGLNDLHLGLGLNFMFELLSGGILEYLSGKINAANIGFGFGGIARLGKGLLDSSLILAEHYRLNSQIVILSRDFHSNSKNYEEFTQTLNLEKEVKKINEYMESLSRKDEIFFNKNRAILKEKINKIVYPE